MKKILICSLLIIAFSLSGCQINKDQSNGTLEEFDIVLDWYPNAVHAFIYEAIEKGYYENEGLKVNIQFPSNANDAISLAAAGKADAGIFYMQDVITTRANQNIPVKSIGSIVQQPLSIILSLKDKNINTAKDLVDKKIGYAGTELSESIIRVMLKNADCDPSSVELIDVGFDLMSAMTTGSVDATIGCMLNHEVPVMEKEGFAVNYFSPIEYGVPNYYELVLIASDTMIENNQDKLVKFMRASKKGFDEMKKNPEEALDLMIKHQNAENFPLEKVVEQQSLDVLLPLMEKEQAPFLSQDPKVWETNIKWLKAQDLIKNEIAVEDIMFK